MWHRFSGKIMGGLKQKHKKQPFSYASASHLSLVLRHVWFQANHKPKEPSLWFVITCRRHVPTRVVETSIELKRKLLVDLLSRWLVDSLSRWLVDSLTCWLVDSLTCWLVDLLTRWLVDLLTCWLVDSLTCCLVDSLTCCLVDTSVFLWGFFGANPKNYI